MAVDQAIDEEARRTHQAIEDLQGRRRPGGAGLKYGAAATPLQLRRAGLLPCELIASGADAAELSLAENVVRVAMYPPDHFEAFLDLVEHGVDPASAARRL